MATLTDTAIFSKKALNFLVFVLGITIVLFVGWRLGKALKNIILPPPSPPATVAFDKISPLDLSEGIKPQGQVTFSIETITGDLPKSPKTGKVFMVLTEESFFGALERTKIKVANIGFNTPPQLAGNVATFIDPKEGGRTLVINIVDGNFKFDSNYINDPQILSSRPKSLEDAVEKASSFLSAMDMDRNEFPTSKTETLKYKIENDKLVETPAISSANLVQVNFSRANLDNIAFFTPRTRETFVKVLVSKEKIVFAEVDKVSIERHKFSTYPLKEPRVAYEDLKNGKGVFNREVEGSRFPIRDVTLGYLESKKPQGFLQPIYVFRSDHGLAAYVGAVDEGWVGKK